MAKHIRVRALLIGASASALCFSAPAYAQAAEEANADADIVVTATRRSERLQDVPLAVSAISGEQLAEGGFQNLTDIQYQFVGCPVRQ